MVEQLQKKLDENAAQQQHEAESAIADRILHHVGSTIDEFSELFDKHFLSDFTTDNQRKGFVKDRIGRLLAAKLEKEYPGLAAAVSARETRSD